MKRRAFLKKATASACALSVSPLLVDGFTSHTNSTKKGLQEIKLSLAQWSLHRSFRGGQLDVKDFASIAKNTYDINAVEYVNGFYRQQAEDEKFWLEMNQRAKDAGVKNLLIMVDDEGDMGTTDAAERKKSVKNHYKWVNAAKIMGSHSIRVNAFGDSNKGKYRAAIIDSMSALSDYAANKNIDVIIENHGLFSSDAKLIAGIIKEVDKSNFGALPDFGNWCLSEKWGTTQGDCEDVYDRYQGVAELLPYAKAVSAKSYNFNANGEDSKIDYYKMLKIVKDSGFNGYIGIEYEGTVISEHEGILATKALLEKVWESLS